MFECSKDGNAAEYSALESFRHVDEVMDNVCALHGMYEVPRVNVSKK